MLKNEVKDTDYNYNQTNTSKFASTNYNYKNNSQNIKNINPYSTLSVFSSFKGFYNKKFNLTNYKNERENSRSRSRSPERIYNTNKPRGNGIPTDALERIIYLGNIFKDGSFQKHYNMRPPRKTSTISEICDFMVKFRKTHSELESAMMAFYLVSHEIKFDQKFFKTDNNEENNNKIKKNLKNIKTSQKPDNIYKKGKALSLGFTNFFELLLKKMEIKYKHIEGYCKLVPQNNIVHNTISPIYQNLKIKLNNEITKNYKAKNITGNNTTRTKHELKIKSIKSNASMLFNKILKNEENDNIPINHCWNAIYIRGEWYFVDTLLASGGISGEHYEPTNSNPNDKKFCEDPDIYFNPFYFMPLPEYLIMTHLPKDDIWQFVDKTLTPTQFMNKNNPDIAQFYRGVYQYNVELLTHKYPIIEMNMKNNLTIQLRLKKAVLQSDLFDINGKSKIGDVKYSYIEQKNIFIFEPSFPCNGDYIIRVKCRSLTSTDLIYWPLLDYVVKIHNKLATFSHFDKYKKIKLNDNKNLFEKKQSITLPKLNNTNSQTINKPKIINDYSNFFPSKLNKKICYDNDGFFLIEPRTPYLKKGNVIKFKVIVKSANYVTLLDGNHWSNLKKTDKDTFEGEKNIKTDNVSICCLKTKNIFTEVYKFKFAKEKSLDTKFFMAKLMKNKSKIKNMV